MDATQDTWVAADSSTVRSLSELVAQVKDEQGYIVVRERTHRNTAESTNARVKWWSIFQILVLFGEGIFQVWWLKRFFEVSPTPRHSFIWHLSVADFWLGQACCLRYIALSIRTNPDVFLRDTSRRDRSVRIIVASGVQALYFKSEASTRRRMGGLSKISNNYITNVQGRIDLSSSLSLMSCEYISSLL